ncbi:unnamed protein product [Rotaria sordida]|uniref:Uncharacterized protein n=2 Tax=Rotaria sordida TaxID=392033 RepID=A0A815S2E7_9BILA|nr:unnamed protein product [Rotaria sordida]CAF1649413.1 unnamed protein product [Rotaria sordida]
MSYEDITMMDDDTSPSTSTECSSSSSSSSLLVYSSSMTTSTKPSISTTTSNKRRLINCRVLVHTTLENQFLRYGGKLSSHTHLPNPSVSEVRNLRKAMRKGAENRTTSLQKIAEQEVRQALLTAEALANLPRINNLGMILLFRASQ